MYILTYPIPSTLAGPYPKYLKEIYEDESILQGALQSLYRSQAQDNISDDSLGRPRVHWVSKIEILQSAPICTEQKQKLLDKAEAEYESHMAQHKVWFQKEKATAEAKERAEYERLRAKYEPVGGVSADDHLIKHFQD